MSAMPPEIRDRFLGQAKACRDLGSPFTARLCELLAHRLDGTSRFAKRIFDWPPERALDDALALRTAAGFHALVRSRRAAELVATYPPHDASDDALWSAVQSAIRAHDGFLHDYLDSPPQTNEVN